MRKIIVWYTFIGIQILGMCHALQAQNDENYKAPQGLNNWYVEAGGAAFLYSLNYEKFLFRNFSQNILVTGRAGISYNIFNDNSFMNKIKLVPNDLTFPITFSVLQGANREKLEYCAGICFLNGVNNYSEIYITSGIGLRVHESNGFCFRMLYTPYYRFNQIGHWLGVSLGKNFSFKK